MREQLIKKLREKYKNRSHSEEENEKYEQEMRQVSKKYPEKLATAADAIDHIGHIVKAAGIDHVGIGSDFDGGGGLADCLDVSDMKVITLELVRRGYSEEEIAKIWGGNLMRVLREAEAISKK